MWNTDVNKSHWTVLAEAFTVLRDHFILSSPTLQTFIDNVASICGIPSPEKYIDKAGWAIEKMSGRYEPRQKGFLLPKTSDFTLKSMSVHEIVCHCLAIPGYARQRPGSTWPLQANVGSLALAADGAWVGEPNDPLGWLFNAHGEIQDEPILDFVTEDLYSDDDHTVNEPVYIPYIDELQESEEVNRAQHETNSFVIGFPYANAFQL